MTENMITIKRLSAAQRAVFQRVPCAFDGRWVTFTEDEAPALLAALEALTDVEQRTQMKCMRRVRQALGEVIEVQRRMPSVQGGLKVRTSDAQRGVLQFIDKHLVSGLILGETRAHTSINLSKGSEALNYLRDMHRMQVNTRACHSLIKALEAQPLVTADPFTAAPLVAVTDDNWVEDEAFTEQFEETSARVHDPLHEVRPSTSPDDVVDLPLTPLMWGEAYARVEHLLGDYGYTPSAGQVSVKRAHISGLHAQLNIVSVHGHGGRFINYDYESALDEELDRWVAAAV